MFSFTSYAGVLNIPGIQTQGYCGTEGEEGTNAEYIMYDDNVLVISGEGNMKNYTSSSLPGWNVMYPYTQMGFMQKIVVAYGITYIGDYAFYVPDNYSSLCKVNLINLADSVETIGDYAFSNEKYITSITIPQNVTSIGTGAFSGCSDLNTINCYSSPTNLSSWNPSNSGVTSGCEIHVMKKYEGSFSFSGYTVIADLTEPTNVVPAGKNILVSYDDPSPSILAGALPYSVKSVKSNNSIWPITYGARGFVTCVMTDGGEYYALTNNNTGALSKVYVNSTSGKATHIEEDETYTNVTVKLSHEYVGNNTVKIIYTVKNTTASEQHILLGSSGDIKIGNDDYAAINTLTNNASEIGITMTSHDANDLVNGEYPTLGFAGKQVGGSAGDVNYFYGAVDSNKTDAATGVRADGLIPERIFSENSGKSQTTGALSGKDSGLSFYWDVTLPANAEKQYAVMFSVPNSTAAQANQTVINEVQSNLSTNTSGFYTTSDDKKIYFNNEFVPRSDDILAKSPENNLDILKNFLILGVQKKTEMTTRNCIRFVSVVNTDILRDAKEYGYIIARISTSSMNYVTARSKIGQVTYESPNIYKKDIKGTSNKVSGNYGKYDEDTPYKYVTIGINDVPDDVVFMARFYVIDKNDNITYADYYNSGNERFDGCAADWNTITAQPLIGS